MYVAFARGMVALVELCPTQATFPVRMSRQSTSPASAVSPAVVLQAVQLLSTVVTSSQDQLTPRATLAAQNTVDSVAASGVVTPNVSAESVRGG